MRRIDSEGTHTAWRHRTRVFAAAMIGAALAGPMLVVAPLSPAAAPSAFAADNDCKPGVMARIPGPPPVLKAIEALPGELRFTGAGVLVSIVDSGVDVTRPQLAPAFAEGSTSLVQDGERPDGLGDQQGHGTAIAGIIAARPEAGSGVVGIAPEASIISMRVFRDNDDESKKAGFGPEAPRIADGIRRSVDLGARIIVVALSDDEDSPELRDATDYAHRSGALVVASAGNRDTTDNKEDTPRYPAAYPGALSVTALNSEGLPTYDSIHGKHIDVASPAQSVLTTATGAGDCIYAGDAPTSSFATAYVAGAAALLAQAYPHEGPDGWSYRLKATAQRPNQDSNDDQIGWGSIRPAAALSLRPDRSVRGPASPFADTTDSALPPPVTRVKLSESPSNDSSAAIAIAVGLGGIVILLTLLRRLRGRGSKLAKDNSIGN